MKTLKMGKINPKALEKESEINVYTREPTRNLLSRLDQLLAFIKKEQFCDLDEFSEALAQLMKENQKQKFGVQIPENDHFGDLPLLKKYPYLLGQSLEFHLDNLKYPAEKNWISDPFPAKQGDLLRASLVHRYYEILALVSVNDRENAFSFIKKFINYHSLNRDKSQMNDRTIDKLEDLYQRNVESLNEESDWEILFGMKDGKYFYRNNNCLWAEALSDLPDKEIKYLVCCYGDYPGAKFYYGDTIILSMEHTIARGDPYCSRVVHDTREDWDLKHFPKAFWDELSEEN